MPCYLLSSQKNFIQRRFAQKILNLTSHKTININYISSPYISVFYQYHIWFLLCVHKFHCSKKLTLKISYYQIRTSSYQGENKPFLFSEATFYFDVYLYGHHCPPVHFSYLYISAIHDFLGCCLRYTLDIFGADSSHQIVFILYTCLLISQLFNMKHFLFFNKTTYQISKSLLAMVVLILV